MLIYLDFIILMTVSAALTIPSTSEMQDVISFKGLMMTKSFLFDESLQSVLALETSFTTVYTSYKSF